jgi:hypothetical protein
MTKAIKITSLMNIGPKVAAGLAEIGITTPASLKKMGAPEAFCRMRLVDPKWNHKMLLYALHGAIINKNCMLLSQEEKNQLNLLAK